MDTETHQAVTLIFGILFFGVIGLSLLSTGAVAILHLVRFLNNRDEHRHGDLPSDAEA